jgi:uncharacterized protein
MPRDATEPDRLAPGVPLPPYRFIPKSGLPHPTADPAGHSFGKPAAVLQPPDPQRWANCVPYLFGFDLFNRGYYWEAHETWEALWHACGRAGPAADCLKGLIKLAAAGVKVCEGTPAGVQSHGTRAAELFDQVARSLGQTHFLGLDLVELARFGRALSAAPPECPVGQAVVFERLLLPSSDTSSGLPEQGQS